MKKREESRNQFILAGLWAWKDNFWEINLEKKIGAKSWETE